MWELRTQLKAWFFGWLFYSFGSILVLALASRAVTDLAETDTFIIGLLFFCGWIGALLQYRFPIGGPRGAPSRSEKWKATLGPNYKIGKALLAAGLVVGATAAFVGQFLEHAVGDDSSVGLIVLVAGQALAAGCIFLGRRMMSKAERSAAASQNP
jgi:hypothetical protein